MGNNVCPRGLRYCSCLVGRQQLVRLGVVWLKLSVMSLSSGQSWGAYPVSGNSADDGSDGDGERRRTKRNPNPKGCKGTLRCQLCSKGKKGVRSLELLY